MRPVLLGLLTTALFPATALAASPRLGLDCTGQQILRSGRAPDRVLSYAIRLNIDVPRGLFCLGACSKIQTFALADARSDPIRLLDEKAPGEARRLLFDAGSMTLIDDRRSTMPGSSTQVHRRATAKCRSVRFVRPPTR